MRVMQSKTSGVAVNEHQVLHFADDLNILSKSLESALNLTMALENVGSKR